jgi:hypothetical protein
MEELSLLTKAMGGAAEQAPILGLIWYMLKDVRARLERFESGLSDLNLRVVAKDYSGQIAHLKELLSEYRNSDRDEHDKIRDRMDVIESELKAVWKLMGKVPVDPAA